jgi:hypothetical protein
MCIKRIKASLAHFFVKDAPSRQVPVNDVAGDQYNDIATSGIPIDEEESGTQGDFKKILIAIILSLIGIATGIIFGNIQTSPLYYFIALIFAIIGVVCIYLYVAKKSFPKKTLIWFAAIFILQALAIVILTFSNYRLVDKSIRIGLEPPVANPFLAYPQFSPSGKMGDIGDINIVQSAGVVRIEYVPNGLGPREDDFKYIDDASGSRVLNNQPANWAGVMFLNPPNNSGNIKDGGIDLRKFRKAITWEARCVDCDANVEFSIGGVTWRWIGMEGTISPYPDTMPRISFGIQKLQKNWEKYSIDLSAYPDDYFRAVVNGFTAVISQSNNQFITDENGLDKPIVIELRNIQYER